MKMQWLVSALFLLGALTIGSVADAVLEGEVYTVEEVIDGSTLKFTNGEEAKLIGIEVPEDGKKPAMEFVKMLVEGKRIKLELDKQEKDKDGRWLAYVYVFLCDNCLIEGVGNYEYVYFDRSLYIYLNATIVKAGYAAPVTTPPNVKYVVLFENLYKEAKVLKQRLKDVLLTEEQAIAAFKKHWQEVLLGLDEPKKSYAAALSYKVEPPEDKSLSARLRPCAWCYDRVKDTLTEKEKERLILYGAITDIQRDEFCWAITSYRGFNAIEAYLRPDIGELIFMWIVPEG